MKKTILLDIDKTYMMASYCSKSGGKMNKCIYNHQLINILKSKRLCSPHISIYFFSRYPVLKALEYYSLGLYEGFRLHAFEHAKKSGIKIKGLILMGTPYLESLNDPIGSYGQKILCFEDMLRKNSEIKLNDVLPFVLKESRMVLADQNNAKFKTSMLDYIVNREPGSIVIIDDDPLSEDMVLQAIKKTNRVNIVNVKVYPPESESSTSFPFQDNLEDIINMALDN